MSSAHAQDMNKDSMEQLARGEPDKRKSNVILVVSKMLEFSVCRPNCDLVDFVVKKDWSKVGLVFKDLLDDKNVKQHTNIRHPEEVKDRLKWYARECGMPFTDLIDVGQAPIMKFIPKLSQHSAAPRVVTVLFGLLLLVCMAAVVYLGWQAVSWESKPADPSDKERLAALEGNITALCGTVVELKEEVQALRASYATREQIRDEQFQKVLANVEAEGRNAVSEAVKEVVKKAQIQEQLIKDMQTRTITADELVSRLQTRFNKLVRNVTALRGSVKNVATQVKPLMERLAKARKEARDVQGNLNNTKEGVKNLTVELALVLNDWSNSYYFRIGYLVFLGFGMAAVMLWEDHVVRRHRDDPFKLKTSHEIAGLKGRVSILESIVETLQPKGQRARQPGPPGGPK
jgi:predicted  nucleic acid-binding Zn-ribbon protein